MYNVFLLSYACYVGVSKQQSRGSLMWTYVYGNINSAYEMKIMFLDS